MPDLELTAASVVGRDPGDVFYDFTIDRGSLSGISTGDAVITEMGVVGVVEEVYATSSRVRSILSEETQIGAVAKETGESGVISSDIQFANSGKVRLNYLTRDTQIQPGAIVTTSGAGGMFPSDLLIGRVDSVERSKRRFVVLRDRHAVRRRQDRVGRVRHHGVRTARATCRRTCPSPRLRPRRRTRP